VATTRLSAKNQITLPTRMVRALGLKPGDAVDIVFAMDALVIDKAVRGKELLDRLQGSMAGSPGWETKEAIDAWIANERNSWDREE
jgi:antitoxin component of MazEF toxin-antitoxin module